MVERVDPSLSEDVAQFTQKLLDRLRPMHNDFLAAVEAGKPQDILKAASRFYTEYQGMSRDISNAFAPYQKEYTSVDVGDDLSQIGDDLLLQLEKEGDVFNQKAFSLHEQLANQIGYNADYMKGVYQAACFDINTIRLETFDNYTMEAAAAQAGSSDPADAAKTYHGARIALLEKIKADFQEPLASSDGYPSDYSSEAIDEMLLEEQNALQFTKDQAALDAKDKKDTPDAERENSQSGLSVERIKDSIPTQGR